jgi:hypothetical protein
VAINNPTSLEGLVVDGCFFENMKGQGSEQGQAVFVDEPGTGPVAVRIVNNEFNLTENWAVRLIRCRDAVIANNVSRNHRFGVALGSQGPVISMTRVQDVTIEGNVVVSYSDGAIDLTPSSATVSRNIRIGGNQFVSAQNAVEDVIIGGTAPGSTGAPEEVVIEGNLFYKSGRNIASLRINSCLRLICNDNLFDVLSVSSGNVGAIQLRGDGEGAGTANYNGPFTFSGNQLFGSTSGGSLYLFDLVSTLCTSGVLMEFRDNRGTGGTATFRSGASVTDVNVSLDGQGVDGFTFSGTVAPLFSHVRAGVVWPPVKSQTATPYTVTVDDDTILADATAGAITLNLPAVAGLRGKRLTVTRTSAANSVILDGSGAETIDGAATKSLDTQYATITIVCDGAAWYSVSRAGTIT